MIRYQDHLEGVDAQKLQGFFQGWRNPQTPEYHLQILEQSSDFLLAVDDEQNKVVGFITILTDNLQAVFISLLEVLPDHQRQGIGSQLLKRVLHKYQHIPAIDLMCDPNVQAFYQRLGMTPSVGMIVRNYEVNLKT